ncbi:ribonuclease H-like protein [Auriscalpium vulgare]|uniref:Ribonuclease H-like protein n=1 Tax=Auriscalpium vulgare TaxID=40419 RepID=A0ACB8SC71_9AGAM|nr:ribonuclease H-like protein [Auriscalpium vulgare]
MFSTQGRFHDVPCPARAACTRPYCLFSHSPTARHAPLVVSHVPSPQPVASTSASGSAIPAKRPAAPSPSPSSSSSATVEPPRKLQKLGTARKPLAHPTTTHAPTATVGPPVLRANAGVSKIAISTRQAMIKALYDHFVVLYDAVLPQQPSLAAEHALRQEQEIYSRSSKITYRNAVITSIATLKTRQPPNSLTHPSVGTNDDLKSRPANVPISPPPSTSPSRPFEQHGASTLLDRVGLKPSLLAPLELAAGELVRWNYMASIPESWGPGGEQPSAQGSRVTCERCRVIYVVENGREGKEDCTFHWGKMFFTTVNGERTRTYTCCSRLSDAPGCTRGPHVFYETTPAMLHARHSFTFTQPANEKQTTLDVAALDCEMVYTTGGFRIARVSVVDGAGKEVFDEFVKMDDGVEVVDFNTRFSGLTPELYASRAVLPLAAVKKALSALISAETILLGHALDNDLRALRLVHLRCVDTVALFVHPRGWPYRRALRDLTKEHLGRSIQTGDGTVGHSSVEDSVATLDLVKWFVANKKTKPAMVGLGAPEASPQSSPAKVVSAQVTA